MTYAQNFEHILEELKYISGVVHPVIIEYERSKTIDTLRDSNDVLFYRWSNRLNELLRDPAFLPQTQLVRLQGHLGNYKKDWDSKLPVTHPLLSRTVFDVRILACRLELALRDNYL